MCLCACWCSAPTIISTSLSPSLSHRHELGNEMGLYYKNGIFNIRVKRKYMPNKTNICLTKRRPSNHPHSCLDFFPQLQSIIYNDHCISMQAFTFFTSSYISTLTLSSGRACRRSTHASKITRFFDSCMRT